MKNIRKILLLSALIVLAVNAFGQAQLKITQFEFPGYLNLGNGNAQFGCYILNYGNSDFNNDTLDILYQTDFSPSPALLWKAGQRFIPRQDSIQISGYFKPDYTKFRVGSNIVVIWPENAARNMGCDTLTIPNEIAIGIAEEQGPPPINIYPNPASTYFSINYQGVENQVDYVRIMSLLGQEVYSSSSPVSKINIESLKSGEYFLALSFKNKSPFLYRFMKE